MKTLALTIISLMLLSCDARLTGSPDLGRRDTSAEAGGAVDASRSTEAIGGELSVADLPRRDSPPADLPATQNEGGLTADLPPVKQDSTLAADLAPIAKDLLQPDLPPLSKDSAVSPDQPTPGPQLLRVLSWNLKGHDRASVDTQATLINQQNPHLVLLQEVDYANRAAFETALEQKSGVNWWRSPAVHSQDGSMVLSRINPGVNVSQSIGGNSWGLDRTASRMEIVFNGVTLNVFGTHLDIAKDWSGGYVLTNMTNLLSWAASVGAPRIIGGDFNASQDSGDALQVQAIAKIDVDYTDLQIEVTGCVDSGTPDCQGTHENSWRPDHIYRSKASALQLAPSAFTIIAGSAPAQSDHYAILAVFSVK